MPEVPTNVDVRLASLKDGVSSAQVQNWGSSLLLQRCEGVTGSERRAGCPQERSNGSERRHLEGREGHDHTRTRRREMTAPEMWE